MNICVGTKFSRPLSTNWIKIVTITSIGTDRLTYESIEYNTVTKEQGNPDKNDAAPLIWFLENYKSYIEPKEDVEPEEQKSTPKLLYTGPIEVGMMFKKNYDPKNLGINPRAIDYSIATVTSSYKLASEKRHIIYTEFRRYLNGKENTIQNGWNENSFRENYQLIGISIRTKSEATPETKTPEVAKPKTIGLYIDDDQNARRVLETSTIYRNWCAQQKGLNLKVIPSEYQKKEYKRDPIYPCDDYLDPEWIPNREVF